MFGSKIIQGLWPYHEMNFKDPFRGPHEALLLVQF